MNKRVLALRYAKAFVNVFYKAPAEDFFERIDNITLFFKNNKEISFYLQLPYIDSTTKEAFLAQIADTYQLKDFLHPLFSLLLHHKRLVLLGDTLSFVSELYKEKQQRIEWSITSYPTLSQSQLYVVQKFLEEKTDKKGSFIYSVDPSLIAGIRAQGKQYLWEHSVQRIIQSLSHTRSGVNGGN